MAATLAVLFLSDMKVSAVISDSLDLVNQLKQLPDATGWVLKKLPSLLLTKPDDPRIDTYAETTETPFIAKCESSPRRIVVVNPNRYSGILWWKTYSRLVLTEDRWNLLLDGETQFAATEQTFLSHL